MLISCLAWIAALLGGPVPDADAPPNVVIIFTDDQGWLDLGVAGGDHVRTPHLDRMAGEGTRFTNFYVAQPVCRRLAGGILTGCYPNRIGIAGALGPNARHGLSAEETTLAELCRARGYATAAFGKWHLGHHPPFLPTRHGFDEFFGIPYSNDMWPMHPEAPKGSYPPLPLFDQEKVVAENPDQRRFTTEFTDRAVRFIERHRESPFFLYLAHPMPHVPLAVHDDRNGATDLGLYADVIAEIDWSVGRVLDALARHGLDERTLVLFISDNGPWLSYGDHAGRVGHLREGKGTTFEGGVRVPCIARWPGRVPAASVCATPLMTIDVLPTVADLIGADLPEHRLDGRSIREVLLAPAGVATAPSPHEAYFFYYHQNDLEAMRSGRWKLHFPHRYRSMGSRPVGHAGVPGRYDYGVRIDLALFDLHADPGETTNVADAHPDVVARLTALADTMRADLGDRLTKTEPTGNREPGRLPDAP